MLHKCKHPNIYIAFVSYKTTTTPILSLSWIVVRRMYIKKQCKALYKCYYIQQVGNQSIGIAAVLQYQGAKY